MPIRALTALLYQVSTMAVPSYQTLKALQIKDKCLVSKILLSSLIGTFQHFSGLTVLEMQRPPINVDSLYHSISERKLRSGI